MSQSKHRSPSRQLLRWRYTTLQVEPHGKAEQAGSLLAGSSDEALEETALSEGWRCEPSEFHHWHAGGWAKYVMTGKELTVLVVVTDPKNTDPRRASDCKNVRARRHKDKPARNGGPT
jgi:hypothetical protein